MDILISDGFVKFIAEAKACIPPACFPAAPSTFNLVPLQHFSLLIFPRTRQYPDSNSPLSEKSQVRLDTEIPHSIFDMETFLWTYVSLLISTEIPPMNVSRRSPEMLRVPRQRTHSKWWQLVSYQISFPIRIMFNKSAQDLQKNQE